jgi:methylthioribose-1-phosphate isomerase
MRRFILYILTILTIKVIYVRTKSKKARVLMPSNLSKATVAELEQKRADAPKSMVSREELAQSFRSHMEGKLTDDKLDAAVKAILAPQYQEENATAYYGSAVLYAKVEVWVDCAQLFTGQAGGLATPGSGYSWGVVYTPDCAALAANTVSFAFVSAISYFSVYFFDGNSNSLGFFQGGGISSIIGTGGGTGGWG